ncbi:energy transducer TonB [Methylibium rhizosphaerae]|uniref:energy transducer TonB n=1 Tax=Methylibium rhizosphaerae TaxID=2570323 RepID=UPI0015E3303B|nr:TonB family protein [Methylibium rhizosphaerae]
MLYCALLLGAGGLQPAAAQSDPSTDPRFAEAAERARLEGDKVFRRILINGQLPKRAGQAAAEPAAAAAARRTANPPPGKAAAPTAAAARQQTANAEAPSRTTGPSASPVARLSAAPSSAAASAPKPPGAASAPPADVPATATRPLTAEARPDTSDGPAATTAQAAAPEQEQPLILVHQVDPDFPVAIVRRQKKGAVTVRFEVQLDGSVNQPEVIRSSNPRLNPAALAAVAQWKFEALLRPQTASAELAFDLHQSFDQ